MVNNNDVKKKKEKVSIGDFLRDQHWWSVISVSLKTGQKHFQLITFKFTFKLVFKIEVVNYDVHLKNVSCLILFVLFTVWDMKAEH